MMAKITRVFFTVFLLPGLIACSSDSSSDGSVEEKPRGVIPQSQLDALNKAAGVSEVLEKAEEDRRKQMEAQGI